MNKHPQILNAAADFNSTHDYNIDAILGFTSVAIRISRMNLPKFLYADHYDDDGSVREFVIHNHWPRFIMEFIDGQGTPHFLDPESQVISLELEAGREPAVLVSRLMREAGEFFAENTP